MIVNKVELNFIVVCRYYISRRKIGGRPSQLTRLTHRYIYIYIFYLQLVLSIDIYRVDQRKRERKEIEEF